MTTIAIANQKGGVGKTTTCVNLGAALAELGHRVLLIDLDPQAHLTTSLGLLPDKLENTIYTVLIDDEQPLGEVVVNTGYPGVDLAPANIDLSGAEIELISEVGRDTILRDALEAVHSRYDYVLIDCSPSLGLLTINAVVAADTVIVPLQCEYLAMRGMAQLQRMIGKVRRKANSRLEVRILGTMFDGRTLHARDVLDEARDIFGGQVFDTVIRRTVKLAEAPVAGMPILAYASASTGAKAYRELAKEILNGR